MKRIPTLSIARSSISRFSASCSSKGYFKRGKSATGQSCSGMSTRWMPFDRVADSDPINETREFNSLNVWKIAGKYNTPINPT